MIASSFDETIFISSYINDVGFGFLKKVGDNVGEGEPILKVIYNDKEKFDEAFSYIQDAIVIENVSTDYAKNLKDRRHVLDIVE